MKASCPQCHTCYDCPKGMKNIPPETCPGCGYFGIFNKVVLKAARGASRIDVHSSGLGIGIVLNKAVTFDRKGRGIEVGWETVDEIGVCRYGVTPLN